MRSAFVCSDPTRFGDPGTVAAAAYMLSIGMIMPEASRLVTTSPPKELSEKIQAIMTRQDILKYLVEGGGPEEKLTVMMRAASEGGLPQVADIMRRIMDECMLSVVGTDDVIKMIKGAAFVINTSNAFIRAQLQVGGEVVTIDLPINPKKREVNLLPLTKVLMAFKVMYAPEQDAAQRLTEYFLSHTGERIDMGVENIRSLVIRLISLAHGCSRGDPSMSTAYVEGDMLILPPRVRPLLLTAFAPLQLRELKKAIIEGGGAWYHRCGDKERCIAIPRRFLEQVVGVTLEEACEAGEGGDDAEVRVIGDI
ncbi:MAG: hypothetical protein ACP5NY_04215 [Thermocladium sp.]